MHPTASHMGDGVVEPPTSADRRNGLVTRDELRRVLAAREDVRLVMTLSEFDYRIKHIPGSIRAEKPEELLDLPHDREVIVYGANEACAQAIRAQRFLEGHGYRGVRRYAGGIVDWEDAGLPLESGVSQAAMSAGRDGPADDRSPAVKHPLFARVLDRVTPRADARGQAEHRHALLADLAGRVIEVGAGNGASFRHYPSGVTEVVAVEPEAYLRRRAAEEAVRASVSVQVIDATAERLPFDSGRFDAGVVSLVLCSVKDPAVALSELFRVIRPGGELHFYEHVLAESAGLARAQHAADAVLWPHIAGGCHTGRRTVEAIMAAGFEVEHCQRLTFRPFPLAVLTSPHVLGRARRPAHPSHAMLAG